MADLEDFSTLARRWAPLYRTRETSYIAIQQSGTWCLLYSREVFLVDAPLDTPPLVVETPSIRAGQFRSPLGESDALEIMERTLAERGQVTVGQWRASLFHNTPIQERFERLYPARMPGQMRLPTYVIESGALDLRNARDALVLELLECSTPYESLEELCTELRVGWRPVN